jgi:hypothetical protein
MGWGVVVVDDIGHLFAARLHKMRLVALINNPEMMPLSPPPPHHTHTHHLQSDNAAVHLQTAVSTVTSLFSWSDQNVIENLFSIMEDEIAVGGGGDSQQLITFWIIIDLVVITEKETDFRFLIHQSR